MSRVGFECVHCQHNLSVNAELAGKAVRCPKCHLVVVAPNPATSSAQSSSPPSDTMPTSPRPKRPEAESIFSDPDESDGDSLFAAPMPSNRKPIIPLNDELQPTIRVPGVALPPPTLATALPTVTVVVPKELPDPFQSMVQEAVEAEAEDDYSSVQIEPTTNAGRGLKIALLLVGVYASLATVAAIWGWVRALFR